MACGQGRLGAGKRQGGLAAARPTAGARSRRVPNLSATRKQIPVRRPKRPCWPKKNSLLCAKNSLLNSCSLSAHERRIEGLFVKQGGPRRRFPAHFCRLKTAERAL